MVAISILLILLIIIYYGYQAKSYECEIKGGIFYKTKHSGLCIKKRGNYKMSIEYDTGLNTTPGMWKMVSEVLDGEQLPESLNKAIHKLCEGEAIILGSNENYFKFVQGMEVRRNKP